MVNKKTGPGVNLSGFGKQGYCKLCSFEDPIIQDDFDKRVAAIKKDWEGAFSHRFVYTTAKLNEWLEKKGFQAVSRTTLINHRDHVAHPKDRLVNAVVRRQREGYLPRAKTTETEYVDAVINAGMARVTESPEDVTIDQALKAAQIRANMKKSGADVSALIAIFTGGVPADEPNIIEGEAQEI